MSKFVPVIELHRPQIPTPPCGHTDVVQQLQLSGKPGRKLGPKGLVVAGTVQASQPHFCSVLGCSEQAKVCTYVHMYIVYVCMKLEHYVHVQCRSDTGRTVTARINAPSWK